MLIHLVREGVSSWPGDLRVDYKGFTDLASDDASSDFHDSKHLLRGVVAWADGSSAAEFHDRSRFSFFESDGARCLPLLRAVFLWTRRQIHLLLPMKPLCLCEYLILPMSTILMPCVLRGSIPRRSRIQNIARFDPWKRVTE